MIGDVRACLFRMCSVMLSQEYVSLGPWMPITTRSAEEITTNGHLKSYDCIELNGLGLEFVTSP